MPLIQPKQINTILPAANKVFYVDKGGNDNTNDGSILRPFATIAKAMSLVPAPALGTIWEISVGPGVFTEPALTLKPQVQVVGAGRNTTILNLNLGVILDTTWTGTANFLTGLANLTIGPPDVAVFAFDFVSKTATKASVFIDNVSAQLAGSASFWKSSDAQSQLTINNSYLPTSGSLVLNNGTVLFLGSEFSDLQVTNGTFSALGGANGGGLALVAPLTASLVGFATNSVSLTGAVNVQATVESIGNFAIVSGSPTITYKSFAPGLGYVPAIPANWSPVPVNVQQALDQLAALTSGAINGLSWKQYVVVSSPTNVNLAAPGATIDGVALAINDRFAAFNQTTGTETGLYLYKGPATPAVRTSDFAAGTQQPDSAFFVNKGTNANKAFVVTNQAPNALVGTNTLAVVQFSSSTGAVPTNVDKALTPTAVALGTTGSTGLKPTLAGQGYIIVMVNGVQQRVFNGPALLNTANLDAAWSVDGITALANTNVPTTAFLYWTAGAPGTAQFAIAASDVVDFDYNA